MWMAPALVAGLSGNPTPAGRRWVTGRFGYGCAVSAYERVGVDAAPVDVVAALRAVLVERGLTEYAVVDHGRDMAAAGSPGFVAWTLVFGNPAAGAKLLARDLAAAVDIPLRLAVVGVAGGGAEIVLREMGSLLVGPGVRDLAEGFTGVLRGIAGAARDRVV